MDRHKDGGGETVGGSRYGFVVLDSLLVSVIIYRASIPILSSTRPQREAALDTVRKRKYMLLIVRIFALYKPNHFRVRLKQTSKSPASSQGTSHHHPPLCLRIIAGMSTREHLSNADVDSQSRGVLDRAQCLSSRRIQLQEFRHELAGT